MSESMNASVATRSAPRQSGESDVETTTRLSDVADGLAARFDCVVREVMLGDGWLATLQPRGSRLTAGPPSVRGQGATRTRALSQLITAARAELG